MAYNTVSSQNNTLIGLSAAGCKDNNTITTWDDVISNVEGKSGSFGIMLKQELGRVFTLETGFVLKNYNYGFTATVNKKASFTYNKVALRTLQVPLILNTKFELLENYVYLIPNLGYILGINPGGFNVVSGAGYGNNKEVYTFISDQGQMTYTMNLQPSNQKTIHLVRIGLNLEFVILKKLHLDINAGYTFSSNRVLNGTLDYKVDQYKINQNPIGITGNYPSLGATLYYPINIVGEDEEQLNKNPDEFGW